MRLYSLIFYAHTCVHTSIQTYCSNIIGCICMHTYNLCTYRHYRLSSIVWRCVLGIAPAYLLDLFILTSSCTGRNSLRSASRGDFLAPHARTAIKQHRAFSIVGPSAWNSLPSELRSLPSSFYKLLKTFIFPRACHGLGSPLSSYTEVALYKFHR